MVSLITFNADMNLYKKFTRCIQVRIAKFPQLLSSKVIKRTTFVDYFLYVSVFATTGYTVEDISYEVEHRWASRKWCGVFEHSSSPPDAFQSGVIVLVRYGDELWILMVLTYPLLVALCAF